MSKTHPHHEDDCFCVDCTKDAYAPSEIVEVDDEIRELIGWRDSLALDDWGDGLSWTIQHKLKDETIFFKEGKSDRIPKHLVSAFKRFMEMNEEEQYNSVFAVLGE